MLPFPGATPGRAVSVSDSVSDWERNLHTR